MLNHQVTIIGRAVRSLDRRCRPFLAVKRWMQTNVSSSNYTEVYEAKPSDLDRPLDEFARRHLGPSPKDLERMLKTVGFGDLNSFVESVVPKNVLKKRTLQLEAPERGYSEMEMIEHLKELGRENQYEVKNLIGKGYYGTILPPVIMRNVLESPEWYTSYTPYQPEISQGRLESLLNFQTVICDLTGLPVSNASLLDEGTAAAEAMLLSYNFHRGKRNKFVLDSRSHPQTKSVVYTRALPLGIEVLEIDTGDVGTSLKVLDDPAVCGCLIQYPATDGSILAPETVAQFAQVLHERKSLLSVASDPLALTLLKAPGHFGADIVLGSSQRFGVPLGYGGPHAAFFAVQERLNRRIPGRIVGVSKDRLGSVALRLALQTREQHIKRDKATSNICTAQSLLANVAANYCVYHGPEGLKNIARRVYGMTSILAAKINTHSPHNVSNDTWFDTLTVKLSGSTTADAILEKALSGYNINLFRVDEKTISLSLDETTTVKHLQDLIQLFTGTPAELPSEFPEFPEFPISLARTDSILTHEVFQLYHSETSMLRYLHRLQCRDLSLANSMIPLGSCTMKLNSTVEMLPITWPEFANIHPFQPTDQVQGYARLISSLERILCSITGFDAVSLQPNSGASGEYCGLRIIRAFFGDKGEPHRRICLIPTSAHGTNPASAAMCGLKVVSFNCLPDGSLDLEDLKNKIDKHAHELAAIMITYPSTYGLYEEGLPRAIDMVHEAGGQVYMDGANMNAQVGLTSPGDLGADICHLNLHKTFAIPHGGGGPAGAPICLKSHLAPYLPRHPVADMITYDMNDIKSTKAIDSVSSGPYGNALVLPISYAYIKMMGQNGLPYASAIAMLSANYMRARLQNYYKILFAENHCAHEFIIDLREFKTQGIEAIDIAKRLQDYGFHAPTLAFPVPHTLMIEPTESENLEELDRFVDSMILIRSEIDSYIEGKPEGQVLKYAPHSLEDLILANDWEKRGYKRQQAAYPLPQLKWFKFWPTVARLDDIYGDMNLMCTCPTVEEVAED